MNNVNLDLSCPTSNKEIHYFKAVTDLVKNNKELLTLLPYKYTRNQYRIKLIVEGSKDDLKSWLELLLEAYPSIYPEVDALTVELKVSPDEVSVLALDNIKHTYPNGEMTDRWFYKK